MLHLKMRSDSRRALRNLPMFCVSHVMDARFFHLAHTSITPFRTATSTKSSLAVSTSPPPSTTSVDNREWRPDSWKDCPVFQGPNYENPEELDAAVAKLKKCSPLVFAGEVRSLHEQLARACSGQGFLLMGGDCAEAFNEFNVDHVRDTFRVLLQMSLVLTFGAAMPIIKVGRMAGQFAKPRSEPDEVRDGVALPSYRGDIINREEFTPEARRHDPNNMIDAYHQSAQTLNILRAFSTGGYADISRLHAWNLDFVETTDEGSRYVKKLLKTPFYTRNEFAGFSR
jgi:3-deoxy-7-phosphoheptulonate synthase